MGYGRDHDHDAAASVVVTAAATIDADDADCVDAAVGHSTGNKQRKKKTKGKQGASKEMALDTASLFP